MVQTFRTLALFFLCCYCGQAAAQTFSLETVPDPKQQPSSHYVSNPAGILSAASVARIDSILGRLEDSATAQVAVVVLPSIGDAVPKDFANALFKKWGVGRAQKDNGLLLLFVLDQRRVEFETGYGLEGVLPDITCGRIQREKMVPAFKAGNYDAGITAGVEAIAETLLQPAAVQEIEADEMDAYTGTEELDGDDLTILACLLAFGLSVLRLFRFFVRTPNAVKQEIDAAIRKKKGYFWLGLLTYGVVPITVAWLLGYFHQSLSITWGGAFLACYAYLAFIIWDSRARRTVVFNDLYGKLPEPQQYLRLQTASRFYWFDALLFPIPFLWIWYAKNKTLQALRNHPRYSPEGYPLVKIAADKKAGFLSPYQKVEEKLRTVEYDIWRNDQYNLTEAVAYESMAAVKYTRCQECQSKAVEFEKEEVIKAATTEQEGRSKRYYECKACGAKSSKEVMLAIIKPVSVSTGSNGNRSASSSGWSSGSSSYSSGGGSSWGGGRSGGGGAGSSW